MEAFPRTGEAFQRIRYTLPLWQKPPPLWGAGIAAGND